MLNTRVTWKRDTPAGGEEGADLGKETRKQAIEESLSSINVKQTKTEQEQGKSELFH